MGKKVVHVPDSVHARLKEHCEREGIELSSWVSSLILKELGGRELTPVEKKVKTETHNEDQTSDGPKPWERPPFWANKTNTVEVDSDSRGSKS